MANILIEQENADYSPNSTASKVTVYADRALVRRVRKVELAPGETVIAFTNLGNGILEESIKAEIGTARLVSARLLTDRIFVYKSARDKAVFADLKAALERSLRLYDEQAVFALETKMLQSLRAYVESAMDRILLEQEVSLPRFSEALGFLYSRIEENSSKAIGLKAERERFETELAVLRLELQKIRSLDSRLVNTIEVRALSESGESIEAAVSYLVPGALWRPCYDTALDTETGKVTLSYYGSIRQSSGEDWENAALVLSTQAVELSPEIPPVYPVTLSARERERTKSVYVSEQDIKTLPTRSAGAGEGEGGYPEAVPGEGDGDGGMVGGDVPDMAQAAEACLFAVPDPATIPSDGLWHKVIIEERSFAPVLEYESIPQVFPYVYLKATMGVGQGLPLLAGKASVFRNGSFLGYTNIAYSESGAALTLSFGIDEDIRILVRQLYGYHEPAKGLSLRNGYFRAVRFLLYNYKDKPVTVTVKDASYVSELSEVRATIDDAKTTKGYVRDAEGVVSWKPEVPAASREFLAIEFHQKLDSPKSFDLTVVTG